MSISADILPENDEIVSLPLCERIWNEDFCKCEVLLNETHKIGQFKSKITFEELNEYYAVYIEDKKTKPDQYDIIMIRLLDRYKNEEKYTLHNFSFAAGLPYSTVRRRIKDFDEKGEGLYLRIFIII